MADTKHSKLLNGARHALHNLLYPTETDLLNGTNEANNIVLTADNVDQIAKVATPNALYRLINHAPLTWEPLGGGGASSPTFNDVYNNESGVTRSITANDGSISWNLGGSSGFVLDLSSLAPEASTGLLVNNGADSHTVIKSGTDEISIISNMKLMNTNLSEGYNLTTAYGNLIFVAGDPPTSTLSGVDVVLTASQDVRLNADSGGNIYFDARGSGDIGFNQLGHVTFDTSFTAASVVGCINEVKTQTLGVYNDGGLVARRPSLNLIPGDNMSIVAADNAGATRVDVTLNSSASGAALGETWEYVSGTTDSNPGDKKFKLNNASPPSATFIYVSNKADNNMDVSNILLSLGTNDIVYIQDNKDSTRAHIYKVTGAAIDATTYVKIPVTIESSADNNIQTGEKCGFVFLFSGSNGGGGFETKTLAQLKTLASTASDGDAYIGSDPVWPQKKLFVFDSTSGTFQVPGETIPAINGETSAVSEKLTRRWVVNSSSTADNFKVQASIDDPDYRFAGLVAIGDDTAGGGGWMTMAVRGLWYGILNGGSDKGVPMVYGGVNSRVEESGFTDYADGQIGVSAAYVPSSGADMPMFVQGQGRVTI